MTALVEAVLDRVSFDYGVELLLSDRTVIRIEASATLETAAGVRAQFDSERPGVVAGMILGLLHEAIEVAVDGSMLRIRSRSGPTIHVPPDDDFEAWTVVSGDGLRRVCGPGGEVVSWPAG